ncbi:MAG: LolA-like outer membrane lipoprotein chaperone [Campylobacterota bacterium]|nr:LolA-like outer membrane lipoprotein chaperone [Campylobacterota bacterium]
MMKFLLGSLLTCKILSGFPIELSTIESDFTQTIIDDHNKSIIYSGKLWAKKPAIAHWSYLKPILKDIHMKNSKVTIIEPDLEQVIFKDMGDAIDLIGIISNSKKITSEHYVAQYNEKDYHIYLDKKVLKSLQYVDDFGNSTVIDFKHMKQNVDINDSDLEVIIPEDYDIIK